MAVSRTATGDARDDLVDRKVVLQFLLSGAFWLVFAPTIGVILSIKFNYFDFLGGISWLTWGRLRPVHVMGVIFGAFTTSIFGLMATQGFSARADEALEKLAKDPKQWVMQQGDDANTRYSKLNQINASNVKKLQVAWTFSTGVLRGHEGGPLVVGDVMYVHTPFPNTVYALDLNHDGKILWKYEPRQDPNVIPIMCCDTVNRGVAYADGKIFLHQADTTLVALDAKTGAPVETIHFGDRALGALDVLEP